MKNKSYKKLGDLRGKKKDKAEIKLAKKKVRKERITLGLTVIYTGTEPVEQEPDEDYKLTWFSKIEIGERFYSYSRTGSGGALQPCRKESDTSVVWLRREDREYAPNELIEGVSPRCLVYKIIKVKNEDS